MPLITSSICAVLFMKYNLKHSLTSPHYIYYTKTLWHSHGSTHYFQYSEYFLTISRLTPLHLWSWILPNTLRTVSTTSTELNAFQHYQSSPHYIYCTKYFLTLSGFPQKTIFFSLISILYLRGTSMLLCVDWQHTSVACTAWKNWEIISKFFR